MLKTYKTIHRSVILTLFISFCLQSCHNSFNNFIESTTATDSLPVPEKVINNNYEYEDNDMYAILMARLTDLINRSPDYLFQQIITIPSIDNIIGNQLATRLEEDKTLRNGDRILLIPCNLGGNHWIGILVQINNSQTKVKYIDSLNGYEVMPEDLKKQIDNVYSGYQLETLTLLKQDDLTSCGAYTIENLLLALQNLTPTQTSTEEIRASHLSCLQQHEPIFYQGFYIRQKHNLPTTASIQQQLGYLTVSKNKWFTKQEVSNILKIQGYLSNITDNTIKLQIQNAFKAEEKDVKLYLDAIRTSLKDAVIKLKNNSDKQIILNVIELLFGCTCSEETISVIDTMSYRLTYNAICSIGINQNEAKRLTTIQQQLEDQIKQDADFARRLQESFWRHTEKARDADWKGIAHYPPSCFEDSMFCMKFKHYKKLIGIDINAEDTQDEKEDKYINNIIKALEELEILLKNKEINHYHIKNLQATFFENTYLFLRHRPKEAIDYCKRPWCEPGEKLTIEKDIETFFNRPDINSSIAIILRQCPSLKNRISTLADIPGFDCCSTIGNNPYIPFLVTVVQILGINDLKQDSLTNLSTSLEQIKKLMHYQKKVVPLLRILYEFSNLGKCPNKQNFDYREESYLQTQIGFVGATVSGIQGRPGWIHYDCINIPSEKVSEARKQLVSYDIKKVREAKKLLLHNQIPWGTFAKISNLLHDGRQKNIDNWSKVKETLPELISIFRRAQNILIKLIEEEASEFSTAPTSYIPEDTLNIGSINYLDNYHSDKTNLEKIHNYITGFKSNTTLLTLKDKYAILRILEVIGESGKNLSPSFTRNQELWEVATRLRDLFAHTERIAIKRKIDTLLKEDQIWLDIINNFFPFLRKFLENQLNVINKLTILDQIESFYITSHASDSINIKPIENFLFLIDSPLSQEEVNELLHTLNSRKKITDDKALVMAVLVQGTNNNEQAKFFESIDKLPLTKNQKKKLKEDYKNRSKLNDTKRKSIKKILDPIKEYDDPEAYALAQNWIEKLTSYAQFNTLSKNLDKLFITNKEPWERLHRKVSKIQKTDTSSAAAIVNDQQYKENLSKTIQATKAVINKLEELLQLTYAYKNNMPELVKALNEDNNLYYACEYCLSSFRKHARIIFNNTKLIKEYIFEDSSEINLLIEEIETSTIHAVKQGNYTLHHHDITTLETRTEYGLRFCAAQDIMNLIYEIPLDNKGNGLIPLKLKLEEFILLLKEKLANITLLDQCD